MKQAFLLLGATALLIACGGKNEKDTPANDEAVVKSASTSVDEPVPDSATMMKNWQEYMELGKEHKMMASWEGTWNADITMWMAPDAPPSKSVGKEVNKMLLGGRYLQSINKGSYDGMPFEGIGVLAFDKAKNAFISTWIDNMGTGMMVGEGPWDETTKSFTIKGRMVDPSTKKETTYRQVLKMVDADTQVMEMFAQGPGGKEFKTMEITYTRAK